MLDFFLYIFAVIGFVFVAFLLFIFVTERMESRKDTNPRHPCGECGLYEPDHRLTCGMQTIEQRAARAVILQQQTQSRLRRIMALEGSVTFWQGKYSIVKHENNKLRRKVYTQRKASHIASNERETVIGE
jgi:hypothetical protein